MQWSRQLNPAPWRDEDEQYRRAVDRQPVSGIGAALRTQFPEAPLPNDLQRLLDKLR